MSVLDTTIEVAPSIPWGSEWLDRSLPSLYKGSMYTHNILTLCVCVLGLVGGLRTRRLHKQLKQADCDRAKLLKQIDERIINISRAHFFIVNIYLLGLFLISGVDAYISFISMQNDFHDHSEMWTPTFVLVLAGLIAGALVLFTAVFFIIPFIQVCVAFWFLTRFMHKHGQKTLADYIPQARAFSTGIALLWASMSFLTQAWTSPDAGMWRWIMLQGAVGSAFAWLDASFAFNFCAHRVRDKEIEVATTGVKEVVAMFGQTMLAVHAKGERDALLPRYKAVQQEIVGTDEKAGA